MWQAAIKMKKAIRLTGLYFDNYNDKALKDRYLYFVGVIITCQ